MVVKQKLRRSKGCEQCRRRRVKCDEHPVRCQECSRLRLSCSGPISGSIFVEMNPSLAYGSHTSSNIKKNEFLRGFCHRQRLSPSIDKRKSQNLMIRSQPFQSIRSGSAIQVLASAPLKVVTPGSATIHLFKTPNPLPLPKDLRYLFDHYFNRTAIILSPRHGPANPFIRHVLPLACSDEMVMRLVLCVSEAHLCTTRNTLNGPTVLNHYTSVLSHLRSRIALVISGQDLNPLPSLLCSLLLCHVESISDLNQGAIFQHLIASTHLVHVMLTYSSQPMGELRTFLLGLHAYLISMAHITPNIPLRYLVSSVEPGMDAIGACAYAGAILHHTRALFELIPRVSRLGHDRIVEKELQMDTSRSLFTYNLLELEIQSLDIGAKLTDKREEVCKMDIASRIYQGALLIYLHTAFYASNTTDLGLWNRVDSLINELLPLVDILRDSAVVSMMLWPYIIIGSCLRNQEQQLYLKTQILSSSLQMAGLFSANWDATCATSVSQSSNERDVHGFSHQPITPALNHAIRASISDAEWQSLNLQPSPSKKNVQSQGVPATSQIFISVLRSCLAHLSAADGAHGFHFLVTDADDDDQIDSDKMALIGNWQTELEPWILVDEVHHVDASSCSVNSPGPFFSGDHLRTALFHVKSDSGEGFQKAADTLKNVVGGWKIKKGEQFTKAENIVREQLRQSARTPVDDSSNVDDIWVCFFGDKGAESVKIFTKNVEDLGLVEKVYFNVFQTLV
ncbi:hypothetical protein B7463_g2346, partial [Scytalidium lignicola]